MATTATRRLRSGVVALVASFGVTLFLPLASASAATNVVADGNFATPVAPTNGFTDFAAPNPFGSWTVASGSVDVVSAGLLAIPPGDPAGTQTLDLDGEAPGEIQQALTGLVPNATYTGTFELNANPGGGGDPTKTLNVLNGATVLSGYTYASTTPGYGTATGWLAETFSFTADASGDATLGFQSTDTAPSSHGPLITDITATEVPGTPLANPLVVIGVIGLLLVVGAGLLLRRRRHTAVSV